MYIGPLNTYDSGAYGLCELFMQAKMEELQTKNAGLEALLEAKNAELEAASNAQRMTQLKLQQIQNYV